MTMIDVQELSDAAFERLPLVREGESKIVRDAGDGQVVVRLKPTIYSFTHHRSGIVPGSDDLRVRASAIFDRCLKAAGVDTAFLDFGPRYILARRIEAPPPIEVIVKAAHVGTPKHRYFGMGGATIRASHPRHGGIRVDDDGRYPSPLVRFDWRNPLVDPRSGEPLADEVLPDAQADWFIDTAEARITALRAFESLSSFLDAVGVSLLDICFFLTEDGKTSFGEVSPDCARFRDAQGDALDKDVWRQGGSSPQVLHKWQALVDRISTHAPP